MSVFWDQVAPVDASLVGLRFANQKPVRLIPDRLDLDHLTIDQHLYDLYNLQLGEFSSQEGKTLTIIGYGDANADGFFNSNDLIQVFQASEYEDDIAQNSYWTTGDWNSDGDFDSTDLVVALMTGQYEAETVVPEPTAMVLLLLGLIALRRSKGCSR